MIGLVIRSNVIALGHVIGLVIGLVICLVIGHVIGLRYLVIVIDS